MPHSSKPQVQPDDWIFIGKRQGVDAVVCKVEPQRVRVVYMSPVHRAMDEWVVWRGDRWAFEQTGPCGGYADRNQELGKHVARLSQGRERATAGCGAPSSPKGGRAGGELS
jgi:hypothetical protein